MSINKSIIKSVIQKEITKLNENSEYWGTEENVDNENEIFNWVLTYEIVNQDWFDEKLKYTNVELSLIHISEPTRPY